MNDNEPQRPSKRISLLKITLTVLILVIGLWVLARFGAAAGTLIAEVRRIADVMNLINNSYVEKPNLSRLTKGAVEGMLKRLDPHSVYIPPAEQEQLARNRTKGSLRASAYRS